MKRAVLALVACASPAAADPLDELGFGAPATALANAVGATATGAASAHGSPAGVALGERPEILLGWQYAHDRLELEGGDADHADAHGTSIGIAIPICLERAPSRRRSRAVAKPCTGWRLGAGVALYLPDQHLARIQLHPITEPHFARLENAAQRLVVEPVAAIARGRWALGAGASILADARTRDLTFEVGVVGGDKRGDARVDLELPLRAAPVASLRYTADSFALAASFRGELSLDLDFDIRANVNVPNVVTGDATVKLRAVSYFSPLRFAVAGAYRIRPDLVASADVAFERWSALGSGVPALEILLALDIEPPLVASSRPPANFRDTVTPRAGIEWRFGEPLRLEPPARGRRRRVPRLAGPHRLRAGAGYLPSPVPAQTGVTSFADGPRLLATLGGGIVIPPNAILAQPIDLDLGLAWQHVFHALVVKDPMLHPGGSFSSGGDILQASASATVRF